MPKAPKKTKLHILQRIPLGTVVHDATGHPWVYIGVRQTTVGSYEHWFRITVPTPKGAFPDYEYRAVNRSTLIKKFPDLGEHWPEGEA